MLEPRESHSAPSGTTSVPEILRSRGSSRATEVLRAVLGETGLPAGDVAVYEGLSGLARAVRAIAGWIPDSLVLRDVALFLGEEAAARLAARDAYSSPIAPRSLNPLHGDFANFPLYSSLVAGGRHQKSGAWDFVAGLACWPYVNSAIFGAKPQKASANVVHSVYPLLRNALSNPATLQWMDALLAGAATPEDFLASCANLPAVEKKSNRVKGLAELATGFVTGQKTPPSTAPEPEEEIQLFGYGTLAGNPRPDAEDLGLEPDDYAASIAVLDLEGDAEPATVHARTIGAARDFNHLHLRWEAATREEIGYFAEAYPALIHDETTQTAAVGLAISIAAGIPLKKLAAFRLAGSMAEGQDFAMVNGTAIVPIGGTLAVVSATPALENGFRQAGKPGSYLPVSPVVVTALPTSCVAALRGQGWQPGETLARRFPTMAAQVRDALAAMRRQTGLRLTPGRLHSAIAKEIFTRTQDECFASLIHPAARMPVGAGRYYLATTCQQVADTHAIAAQTLFPGDIGSLELPSGLQEARVGSQLVVDVGKVADALQTLRVRLEQSLAPGRRSFASVAGAINAHVIWLAVLLRFLAFVRPVVDPLPRPCDVYLDQGFLLVCDKRESPRNEQRLVPLADVLKQQIASTRTTFLAAALYFDRQAPELAAQVRSLLDSGGRCASIPGLPFLECVDGKWKFRELRPEDVACSELPWPANFGRHLGMQAAHQAGLPREIVSVLFGHAEVGQTPFGWDSAWTPMDLQRICAPFLDAHAGRLQLKALPALAKYPLGVAERSPQFARISLFGDDRPERNARRRHLAEAEKAHLRDVGVQLESLAATPPEDVAEKIAGILHAGPKRSRAELDWLKAVALRYLRLRERAVQSGSGSQARRIPLEAEDGPIDRAELLLFNRGLQAREEILCLTEAFLSSSPETAPPSDWIAFIVLHAIAFGGCLRPHAAEGIARACVSGIRTFQSTAFLDWKAGSVSCRFWADAQTNAIIARWFDIRADAPSQLELNEFRDALRSLLAKITSLSDAPYAWPPGKSRLSRLRLAIGAYMRRFVPGVLMAHMQGSRHSAPVELRCLQRELGHYPGLSQAEDKPVSSRRSVTYGNAVSSPALAMEEIRKAVAKTRATSATGGASRGTRGERLRGLEEDLDALEADLGSLINESASTAIVHLVIARVRQLARKGGRLKKQLATSTISEYLAPVFKFASLPVGQRILTAGPCEIAESYKSIILSGSSAKSVSRYRSLSDFHALAVEEFGAEEVEWVEIVAGIQGVHAEVDANLIHPHEIDRAMALLAGAPGVPEDLRLRAMLAISLMADLGLRFGEVFRLRRKHFSQSRQFLYIQNTQDGEVKTANGTRIVPFGALATDRTKGLVDRTLGLVTVGSGSNEEAALFTSLSAPGDLLPRSTITKICNQAIRAATGDCKTRLHHLRHTAATKLFDEIVLPSDRTANAKLLEEIVGTANATRRAFFSLATLLGHGSGQTTATNYLHQQERRIATAMDNLPCQPADKFLSSVISQSENAVRSYRSRGKSQSDLFQTYAKKVFNRFPELRIEDNMNFSKPPAILETGWVAKAFECDFGKVERILRLQFHSGLEPGETAILCGVTETFAANSRRAATAIAKKLRLPKNGEGDPLTFASPRSRLGKDAQPCFSIETIEKTDESVRLAELALGAYDHNRFAWVCRDGYTLEAVLSWMGLSGIDPRKIVLRVPESRLDECQEYLPAQMGGSIRKVPADSRPGRRRGIDTFRVTIQPLGIDIGSRFSHATFLNLIRWTVGVGP